MAEIDETKARLLRNVVRDNVNGFRTVRIRRIKERKHQRYLWVFSGLVIAATAYANELSLWTRNTRDFDGLGLDLFNPWEG